jgi:hypothetical protein
MKLVQLLKRYKILEMMNLVFGCYIFYLFFPLTQLEETHTQEVLVSHCEEILSTNEAINLESWRTNKNKELEMWEMVSLKCKKKE